MDNREKSKEQLLRDLQKAYEEVAIQKWGVEKTLNGMKVLVIELVKREKEAKERTGELADQVKELELLNKSMIDRELKMVELKKEIAALKGAAEGEPRPPRRDESRLGQGREPRSNIEREELKKSQQG